MVERVAKNARRLGQDRDRGRDRDQSPGPGPGPGPGPDPAPSRSRDREVKELANQLRKNGDRKEVGPRKRYLFF